MSVRRTVAGLVLCAMLGPVVAGCGGKSLLGKSSKAVPVSVSVVAGDALNPDAAGRPSPVFLRVFGLRDAATFLAADFDALAADDEALLAGAAVHRRVFAVRPGERMEFTWELDPAVKALTAMAEFRDPHSSTWRASLPITGKIPRKKGIVRVSLQVDGTGLELNVVE